MGRGSVTGTAVPQPECFLPGVQHHPDVDVDSAKPTAPYARSGGAKHSPSLWDGPYQIRGCLGLAPGGIHRCLSEGPKGRFWGEVETPRLLRCGAGLQAGD